MNASTPTQIRTAQIEGLQAVAARLLATAKHQTMQEQVRLASRDLDEGLRWLREDNFDARLPFHRIVDLTIDLANWRLNMVSDALQKYGPDAMVFG